MLSEKRKLGRPIKYNKVIQEMAEAFFIRHRRSRTIPFVEELAIDLGVNDDTLVEWSREYPEFSATLEQLKVLQRLYLKKGGLDRTWQPQVAIFLLKANHGIKDGISEEVTTADAIIAAIEENKKRRNGEIENPLDAE